MTRSEHEDGTVVVTMWEGEVAEEQLAQASLPNGPIVFTFRATGTLVNVQCGIPGHPCTVGTGGQHLRDYATDIANEGRGIL